MSGWYEISKAKDGQFHFVLKAGNGEIILTSELYKAKASALKGIESVQKNSPEDGKYDRLEAKNGKLYFNLKAANHQIIGTSQMYSSAQARDHGIESVKTNGGSEKVKDLTEA
ncbi:YegP family protein [Acinetobacter nectaris]|uniref:YegP family protein n=1 Tax=Acinetobacter nectaris TaxID=1219382 RepID=UPI001F417102|nr:YegP family protein [Acinetobacter nectaris]MCF9033917.1 YegP family protein [Acinetobacter nectaris]